MRLESARSLLMRKGQNKKDLLSSIPTLQEKGLLYNNRIVQPDNN
ncbi:hypothetical protein RRG08_055471 [Elysia crispata]|uniref:Uncharacterized protein n=1 Tax=Elysia crispata TaxID=231223 RepID=A0AAE1DI88_9GAST|nr:hypothetical protein RRG08_055471 [Elysia crispata]